MRLDACAFPELKERAICFHLEIGWCNCSSATRTENTKTHCCGMHVSRLLEILKRCVRWLASISCMISTGNGERPWSIHACTRQSLPRPLWTQSTSSASSLLRLALLRSVCEPAAGIFGSMIWISTIAIKIFIPAQWVSVQISQVFEYILQNTFLEPGAMTHPLPHSETL